MADDSYEREAEAYLARLQSALAGGTASQRKRQRLFEDFLAIVGAPFPDPRVLPLFWSSATLVELAESLFVPFSERLRAAIDAAVSDRRLPLDTFFQIRPLGPLGRYPNVELSSGRAWYAIRHGLPYLITHNSAREDVKWTVYNELSGWTRHETRLATAISCTERGGFTAYLGGGFHEFPAQLIAQVAPPDRILFMVEYVALTGRMSRAEIRSPRLPFSASHTFFEYLDFRPFVRSARTFAANFLVSHPLLLRTAQHYLKSSMLWSTDAFAEDALLNLMSALEGCLLLFQDVAGARTDRIDRKELRAIFSRIYVHGDANYEFIEEAFEVVRDLVEL